MHGTSSAYGMTSVATLLPLAGEANRILHEPFDIETHKLCFINYLEVVILSDGTIEYAVPSHQEKLLDLARQKRHWGSIDAVWDIIPQYADVLDWLQDDTGAINVWTQFFKGTANENQANALRKLADARLYLGPLPDENGQCTIPLCL